LGFNEIGYSNLYTGDRNISKRLLRNNNIKILLKSNLKGQANKLNEDEVDEICVEVDNMDLFLR